MTTPATFMRCQGGHPTGIQGGSAVRPSFLDVTFHRAQARLKRTPQCGLRAQKVAEPLFYRMCAGQAGLQDAVFLFAMTFIATNFIGG